MLIRCLIKLPLLGLLAIPLFGSCSDLQEHYGSTYQILFDPRFTTDQQAIIKSGVAQWQTGLQDEMNLTVSYAIAPANCSRLDLPAGGICVHYSSEAEMQQLGQPLDNTTWAGLTLRSLEDTSDVWLAMDLIAAGGHCDLSQIMGHEFGHCLGSAHSEPYLASDPVLLDGGEVLQPGSLMYWNCGFDGASLAPTSIDLNQVLYLRGLTTQQLFVLYH